MKYGIIFFLSCLLGIGIAFAYKTYQDTLVEKKTTEKIEIPTAFSLEKAPSQTLKGSITKLSGNVGWESRIATEPARIVTSQEIGQGEALETKENGNVTVSFLSVGSVMLSPKTFVGIVQTLPSQFVFSQTKGEALYKKDGSIPVSIDISGLLVKINRGQVDLSFDDTRPVITGDVAAGSSATLAYVDTSNQTTVLDMDGASGFTFNFDTKKLRLLK